ncbi:MAG: hypothetical protein CM1200mP12_01750 [Gammaproteobacteria bacterium]|nr:MAG: hypothetical protein CM1200mP12_01750 [Gammaproteobacteria bacterium]
MPCLAYAENEYTHAAEKIAMGKNCYTHTKKAQRVSARSMGPAPSSDETLPTPPGNPKKHLRP